MSENKINIYTQGGPVINGGTFNNIEFVAQKYVLNEPASQNHNASAPVDVEAVLVDDKVASEKSKLKKRNARLLLFNSEQAQAHWSRVFVDFLKKHNRASEQLTTSDSAFVNRALACFYMQWKERGLLNDRAYVKAPSVFLFEDCGIDGVDTKTHSNRIQSILEAAYKYEQANLKSNIMIHVEEIVKDNI